MINLEEKFRAIANRHGELQSLMSAADLGADDFRKYSIEYSELEEIVAKIKQLDSVKRDIEAAKAIVGDVATEAELKSMAQDEIRELEAASEQLNKEILVLLLPKDADDVKNAILEVRAGTGGEEAALFAADLFRMYQRYSENKGWRFEIMAISDTGIGGYKEATALITGGGVFSFLKYESGVHRVQRVPDTEASGRIHTSAATVSVLAEVEDVDIQINETDLRIDVYRSSGAGGQHVNTTDSAVRITHIPTNTVVAVQDERSQHKNKAKAMKILRSRIYEAEKRKRDSAYAATRKSQVGSGDRSERIRTYNYPQGRVTDHRINLTLYKLQEFLNGSGLDDMQSALAAVEQAEKLATMQEL